MGAILLHSGDYRFMVGAGQQGRDRISVRVPIPRGADIVAFWHTHGTPAPKRRYFSREDTDLALSWNRPLYLVDYTGALKVFSPGDRRLSPDRARRLGLPAVRGFALGRLIEDGQGKSIRISTGPRTSMPGKPSAGITELLPTSKQHSHGLQQPGGT